MCIISFCMNIQNGHDLLSEKYLKSIWCHKWASAVGVFLIEWMFASQDSVYPSVWFRWFCLEDISISYIVHVCTWRECFKIKSPMPAEDFSARNECSLLILCLNVDSSGQHFIYLHLFYSWHAANDLCITHFRHG